MNDDKRLRKLRERAKGDEDAVDALLRDLLDSRAGRLLVWWLLEICKHEQTPATNNALWTYFNIGEQNIGKQVLARVLKVSPAGYIKLLEERKAEDERSSADSAGGYSYHDPAERSSDD